MFLVWGGFVGITWGANRISNGCVPLRTIAWPQGGTITDPCSGTTTTTPKASTPAKAPPAGTGTTPSAKQTGGGGRYPVGGKN